MNSFFDTIRQKIDILSQLQRSMQLKRKGKEYIGLCPFHGEKTPSFTVNVQKGFYHCFGCSAHGDVIQFLAATSGSSYKEAAIKLAKEHGISIPKTKGEREDGFLYKVTEAANCFFRSHLTGNSLEYLKSRKIDGSLIEEFSIGYAPGNSLLTRYLAKNNISADMMEGAGLLANSDKKYEVLRKRLTFPIKNSQGETLGFGGRAIDASNPKYLNTPETSIFKKSRVFFGEDLAMAAAYKSKQLVLVEGYFDVIALHSAGIKQTVGTSGTAITRQHLEKGWKYVDEIVLCLDSDPAGLKATFRAAELAAEHLSTEKCLSVMQLPEGTDPDQARLLGVDLKEHFANRVNLSQWLWDHFWNARANDSPEQRAKAEQKFVEYANSIQNSLLRKHYHWFAKGKLGKPARKKTKPILTRKLSAKNKLHNLEHSLIELLKENPHLLEQDYVLDSLSRLGMSSQGLDSELNHIIEKKGIHNQQCATGASDANAIESFKLLCKRHRLETLKAEYLQLLRAPSGSPGLDAYRQEIASLSLEIADLIAS